MSKKKVTLLYSGGWDGTFRLLQLAQYDIEIQPVYVIDKNRGSTEYERKAMKAIIAKVENRFPATISPLQYYDKEWILENCKDEKISGAFRYLRKTYAVGTQYEWFALLCKKLNLMMESSVVHQYHGKVEEAIEAEGILTLIENDFLPERYQVLPKEENQMAHLVFGNLILPVIKLEKKDEERIARENGWLDIMELSWFCHTPIDGKPCGLCGPCDDAMNTGMEWRLPEEAKKRYKHRTFHLLVRKIKRKLNSFRRKKP